MRPVRGVEATVTVVFLAYNRRDELRISLTKMLQELDYDGELLELMVVDNASTDGTGKMLREEFPSVRVITRTENCGVSAWNDGFAVATGDYILALDDDCYLPHDGLRMAVVQAQEHDAALVSFGVVSSTHPDHRFDLDDYLTGLFAFWGCAVLIRRDALSALGGFDPAIFIHGHELEFMLRFFDRGFRHLHLPEVLAVHQKGPNKWTGGPLPEAPYRRNYRHWGYIAGKLLDRRDAFEALLALLGQNVRDGRRKDRMAFKGLKETVWGFAHGLRHRQPVRPEVSHAYRHNFETFSSPWWFSRTPFEALYDLATPGGPGHANRGRREAWFAERAQYYPDRATVLEL
jgi:GT2 family glycosyltransferase